MTANKRNGPNFGSKNFNLSNNQANFCNGQMHWVIGLLGHYKFAVCLACVEYDLPVDVHLVICALHFSLSPSLL